MKLEAFVASENLWINIFLGHLHSLECFKTNCGRGDSWKLVEEEVPGICLHS